MAKGYPPLRIFSIWVSLSRSLLTAESLLSNFNDDLDFYRTVVLNMKAL